MRAFSRHGFAIALGAAALTTALHAVEVPTSRRDADAAKRKFLEIAAGADDAATTAPRAAKPVKPPVKPQPKAPRRTTITEGELNSYLAFEGPAQFPAGVVEPVVNIVGGGKLAGRAVVDLDAVRKANPPTGLFDPRTLLRGQLPVTMSGTLRTKAGSGQFELESATLGGVPLPKALLQEIVSYYSKTPDHPSGIKLDEAFQLPAAIREIQVDPGRAVIVQ
jgi:hypothetical protein